MATLHPERSLSATTTRPPGLRTLRVSLRIWAISAVGTWHRTVQIIATCADAVPNGSSPPKPCRNDSLDRCGSFAASRCASSTRNGAGSTPMTDEMFGRCAKSRAIAPVPHPISTTVRPAGIERNTASNTCVLMACCCGSAARPSRMGARRFDAPGGFLWMLLYGSAAANMPKGRTRTFRRTDWFVGLAVVLRTGRGTVISKSPERHADIILRCVRPGGEAAHVVLEGCQLAVPRSSRSHGHRRLRDAAIGRTRV